MGAVFSIYFDGSKGLLFPSGKIIVHGARGCKYHESWNELMPVVEKITAIEDNRFSVEISSVGMWACFIKRDDLFENNIADFGGFEPMILNVWKSVVGFIKWYNKENKNGNSNLI